jgi:FkbM family methyltransferase
MSQSPSFLFRIKYFASIAIYLTQATGRPLGALAFMLRALSKSASPTGLVWRGIRLNARAKDWNGLREVLVEQEYGPVSVFLEGGDKPVVLDLGANIGTFSAFVFAHARGAVVHAYEPSLASHAVLSSSIRENPLLSWTAFHGAIFGQDGETSFSNAAASTGSRISDSGDERVPTFSLATAVARAGGHIDLAKMDIEGAEEATLVAGEGQLAHIETLVVEIHPALCSEDNIRQILARNYASVSDIGGRKSSKPLLIATGRLSRNDP